MVNESERQFKYSEGVFLVKMKNVFLPVKRVYSMKTFSTNVEKRQKRGKGGRGKVPESRPRQICEKILYYCSKSAIHN